MGGTFKIRGVWSEHKRKKQSHTTSAKYVQIVRTSGSCPQCLQSATTASGSSGASHVAEADIVSTTKTATSAKNVRTMERPHSSATTANPNLVALSAATRNASTGITSEDAATVAQAHGLLEHGPYASTASVTTRRQRAENHSADSVARRRIHVGTNRPITRREGTETPHKSPPHYNATPEVTHRATDTA